VEYGLPGKTSVARLALVVALMVMWTSPALATTVVPMSEADLAAEAAAVVLGRVTALQSHFDAARGQIFTDVTLAVDEVVAGPPLPATVTLRQPGGQVGNVRTWIDGSPEFLIGERVMVYLKVARDGSLRVLHLYQGKLSVMTDPLTGDEVAIRITGGGVRVLPPRGNATSPPKDTHRLDDLRRLIHGARARALRSQQTAPIQSAPAVAGDIVQQQDAFVFLGTPSRWFEPDTGAAITMRINSAGQPQAPTLGFDEIRQGFAAWSNDPQANFRYADGGFTSAGGLRFDGVNAVSFNDPDGTMDPPVNCSGTLAMGGFSRSTSESRVVNGTTFMRILDGDVVFNDGWQGCGFYEVFGNFAEVATHELGHVLGLGHSTDPTATMFASAHFDGRGASLKADDLAGLRFIYPATAAPALTLGFDTPANGATVSGATTVSLVAAGGTAPYTYQVSLDGTSIATSASFSWNTPAVSDGAHALSATVTDAGGHTASASITVTVANGGGGGTGTLRVAITQPASGATVSGVPWAVMWVEGSNAASNTFTLTLGSQAMGSTTTPSRGPISMPYDTRVVANGTQPLTATVRDASGNSATTTVSVSVSNGGGGAPPPAPPPTQPSPPAPPPATGTLSVYVTSPTSGATVSGTSWVTLWLSGASGGSNTYTLSVGAQTVATTTTSSTGPVSMPWTTSAVADGPQTLTASARDASGNTGAASIAINVANGGVAPPPSPPPTPSGALKVFITSPASGGTVSGTAWVNIWVEGAANGAKVFTLRAGGATVATANDAGVHVTLPWSTAATPNGATTLSATVQDASGSSGSISMPVTVGN